MTSSEEYFTPAELCERWKVDPRTLDKFPLPWVRLGPRTRRVETKIVLTFEQEQRLKAD
jgi:hypothetical protein